MSGRTGTGRLSTRAPVRAGGEGHVSRSRGGFAGPYPPGGASRDLRNLHGERASLPRAFGAMFRGELAGEQAFLRHRAFRPDAVRMPPGCRPADSGSARSAAIPIVSAATSSPPLLAQGIDARRAETPLPGSIRGFGLREPDPGNGCRRDAPIPSCPYPLASLAAGCAATCSTGASPGAVGRWYCAILLCGLPSISHLAGSAEPA